MNCARKRAGGPLLAAMLLGLAAPVAAAAQDLTTPDAAVAEAPKPTSPVSFVWTPEASPDGPVKIVVSLPAQTLYVYRGGVLIARSTVSTGREGHETPAGAYTILQKEVMHHSNLYDDAAMPFMQRLGWDGLALHAGHVTGRPASHGCVRLPAAFARKLYGVTRVGATVVITDEDVGPDDALEASAPSALDAAPPRPIARAPARLPAALEGATTLASLER